MRVAVHHPGRVEDGETIPPSVFAFRVGRITDHVDVLTGETTPKEQVAAQLLEQAKAEFPDCEVVLEVLVHNGDAPPRELEDGTLVDEPHGEGGTSTWVHHEQVPDGAVSPKGGTIAKQLEVEQPQAFPDGAQQ